MTRTWPLFLFLAATLAAALDAGGGTKAPILPVERTPFHIPVFRNDAVAMLNVWLPPHRVAPYHEHSRDFAYVVVRESPTLVQNWGEAEPTSIRWKRGAVGFGAFSKKRLTHRAENVGDSAARQAGGEGPRALGAPFRLRRDHRQWAPARLASFAEARPDGPHLHANGGGRRADRDGCGRRRAEHGAAAGRFPMARRRPTDLGVTLLALAERRLGVAARLSRCFPIARYGPASQA